MTAFNLEYNLKIPRPNDANGKKRLPFRQSRVFCSFLYSPFENLTLEKNLMTLDRLIHFTGIEQLSKAIRSLSDTVSPLSKFPNTFSLFYISQLNLYYYRLHEKTPSLSSNVLPSLRSKVFAIHSANVIDADHRSIRKYVLTIS